MVSWQAESNAEKEAGMNANRSFWVDAAALAVVFAVPLLLLLPLNVAGWIDPDVGKPVANAAWLIACLWFVFRRRLSASDLGLKVVKELLPQHVAIGLFLLAFYLSFYIFVIQISGLRPVSAKTGLGVVNYLLVAFVEEIYFRGAWYGILQNRFSSRTALIVSTLLFGAVHLSEGLGALPQFFMGFLFGSVRYSTRMIFVLILPLHFIYNVVWFLFQGNWDNPPLWAQFMPLVELALGFALVALGRGWVAASSRAGSPAG